MRTLRGIGRLIWRFMVIFSFIVNIVLVVVLIGLGVLIFDIKNNVAQPLVGGLYSSFVGLDQATIDWTIPVRDTIPVNLDIQLQTDTVVTLVQPVPLNVQALIDLPGLNASNVPATVNLTLPQGLQLPVALDVPVPVREELDIALDVRAVIPLAETQLHDVANNLKLLFEPFARILWSPDLPDNFDETGVLVGDILTGRRQLSEIDLMQPNDFSQNPWPGFSLTAGANYVLFNQPFPPPNEPLNTGVVVPGGIPALDEQIRPQIYDQGGPTDVNAQAFSQMQTQPIDPATYNGQMAELFRQIQAQLSGQPADLQSQTAPGGETADEADPGIVTPPGQGG